MCSAAIYWLILYTSYENYLNNNNDISPSGDDGKCNKDIVWFRLTSIHRFVLRWVVLVAAFHRFVDDYLVITGIENFSHRGTGVGNTPPVRLRTANEIKDFRKNPIINSVWSGHRTWIIEQKWLTHKPHDICIYRLSKTEEVLNPSIFFCMFIDY